MKRVCIHQPDFLPYLGFFHRLLLVDTFIILDDVQFLRKGSGWHNRDKIKTPHGEKWLTIPVEKGHCDRKINQVILSPDTEHWIPRNLNLLKENYGKAPYFDEYFPSIQEIYLRGFCEMLKLNMAFLSFFWNAFNIHIETVFSSNLNVSGTKNHRLINLIKAVDGEHYVSGMGAKAYLDEQLFVNEHITVEWQQFHHPVYPQLHGKFIPNLSCIDILFNCGAQAQEILWACKEKK